MLNTMVVENIYIENIYLYVIKQLSCFNIVIRSAENVKLVSTFRESVMQ